VQAEYEVLSRLVGGRQVGIRLLCGAMARTVVVEVEM
jgi:hypothetical protein